MVCIYEFINFLFNNSVFTGFLGVIIGAFLDYVIQTRLNKKQNKFTIEKKVLEGLIEKTNNLALKVSENNYPYVNNRISNELRKYVKVSPIMIDDKINILKLANKCNENNFEIIKYIDNVILYFDLNSIPTYKLSNFKRKLNIVLKDYLEEYKKYQDKMSELSEIIEKDEKITEKYVNTITDCENAMSKIKDEMLFYLTDLNIVIQNELYRDIYKSTVKRIENSDYKKIELIDKAPNIIDINE